MGTDCYCAGCWCVSHSVSDCIGSDRLIEMERKIIEDKIQKDLWRSDFRRQIIPLSGGIWMEQNVIVEDEQTHYHWGYEHSKKRGHAIFSFNELFAVKEPEGIPKVEFLGRSRFIIRAKK